jgi:light-regulated signal transduction histidine kinase (bacteriophytochrome)
MTTFGDVDRQTKHFGTVTASLSHELGNVLATVQEAAGLLDDYAVAATKGELIEAEDLKPVLGRIDRSVTRGFDFLRLLSWIAHSIDAGTGLPPFSEVIEKAAASARYFSRQRAVEIEVTPEEVSASARGSAFELHLLLFNCIRFATDQALEGSTVVSHNTWEADCVRVGFSLQPGPGGSPDRDALRELAEAGGGHVEFGTPEGPSEGFELVLPLASVDPSERGDR